jgi:hypothetical protein
MKLAGHPTKNREVHQQAAALTESRGENRKEHKSLFRVAT